MIKIIAIQGYEETLSRAIAEALSLPQIVTYTTREATSGEVQGVDYNFVTQEEYLGLADKGAFSAVSVVEGEMYALPSTILGLETLSFVFANTNEVSYLQEVYGQKCLAIGVSYVRDYIDEISKQSSVFVEEVEEKRRVHLEHLETLNKCDVVLNVSTSNPNHILSLVQSIRGMLPLKEVS